jgi:hypothetical protein
MAKKKRRRTIQQRRAAGTATAFEGDRVGGSAERGAPIKPAPATPGGPSRIERKEAARRARERLRRQMARRRTYRRVGIALIAAVVVAGIAFLANRPKGSALTKEERNLLAEAPAAMKTAGCGAIQKINDYPNGNDRTHIGAGSAVPTNPPLSSYPSTPPASGPHNPVPLAAGVYPSSPDVYAAIHSLEHAAVIVWYAPGTTSDELAKLQTFFAKANERTKVIVAPYDYPDQGAAGKLPAGKQMVLVAWHHMQTCNQVNLAVAYDFVAHYRFPAPKGLTYEGEAPETGVPIG